MIGGDAGHRNAAVVPFPSNPKLLWSLPLGQEQRIVGPVIWKDGTTYVAPGSRVIAADRTGKKRWTWAAKSQVLSLALGRQGDLYVLTEDKVYALGADGAPTWEADVISDQSGTLIVGQGGVIYTSGREYVYALSSAGKRKWRFKGDDITAGPVERPDGYLAVVVGGELYVLDRDGNTDWHRPVGTPNGVLALAAGPEGRVFLNAGQFIAFDKNGGNRRQVLLESSNPLLAVGKDFVQDGLSRMAFTSQQLWAKSAAGVTITISAVDSQSNALLITLPAPGQRGPDLRRTPSPIRLLGPDGTEKWQFDQVQMSGMPAVSADSRICFVGMQPGAAAYSLFCIGDQ
jgi:outer membrane protein assembly factor BamB